MRGFAELWQTLGVCIERPVYLLLDCAGFEHGFAALPHDLFDRLEGLLTGDLGEELADACGYLGCVVNADAATAKRVEELLDARLALLLVPPIDAEPGSPAPTVPDFAALYRHLRKYNVVYSDEGAPLFFRYYDPRVVDDLLRAGLTGLARQVFAPFESLIYPDVLGRWVRAAPALMAEE